MPTAGVRGASCKFEAAFLPKIEVVNRGERDWGYPWKLVTAFTRRNAGAVALRMRAFRKNHVEAAHNLDFWRKRRQRDARPGARRGRCPRARASRPQAPAPTRPQRGSFVPARPRALTPRGLASRAHALAPRGPQLGAPAAPQPACPAASAPCGSVRYFPSAFATSSSALAPAPSPKPSAKELGSTTVPPVSRTLSYMRCMRRTSSAFSLPS